MNNLSKNLLATITVALLIMNGFLIYQNLNLKAKLEKPAPVQIKEGKILTAFEALDINGKTVKVDYEGNNFKRVLFYFHPTCGWCKKQMPYWNELVSKADSRNFKFTAVTIDDNSEEIKDYINKFGMNSWEVLSMKKADADKSELSGTPTTVVLDSQGKVEKVWIGMWRDDELTDAGKYFSIDFTSVKTDKNS